MNWNKPAAETQTRRILPKEGTNAQAVHTAMRDTSTSIPEQKQPDHQEQVNGKKDIDEQQQNTTKASSSKKQG
jgi:hypothetical protein